MDDGDGGTISDSELDEVLRRLARRGELDSYLERDPNVVGGEADQIAEYFAQKGDNLADSRVTHAAQHAVNLVRNMVGADSRPGADGSSGKVYAAELVEAAADRIEVGLRRAHMQLSAPSAA